MGTYAVTAPAASQRFDSPPATHIRHLFPVSAFECGYKFKAAHTVSHLCLPKGMNPPLCMAKSSSLFL